MYGKEMCNLRSRISGSTIEQESYLFAGLPVKAGRIVGQKWP